MSVKQNQINDQSIYWLISVWLTDGRTDLLTETSRASAYEPMIAVSDFLFSVISE